MLLHVQVGTKMYFLLLDIRIQHYGRMHHTELHSDYLSFMKYALFVIFSPKKLCFLVWFVGM